MAQLLHHHHPIWATYASSALTHKAQSPEENQHFRRWTKRKSHAGASTTNTNSFIQKRNDNAITTTLQLISKNSKVIRIHITSTLPLHSIRSLKFHVFIPLTFSEEVQLLVDISPSFIKSPIDERGDGTGDVGVHSEGGEDERELILNSTIFFSI